MSLKDLTSDEQYLLLYMKSKNASHRGIRSCGGT
jgi:hypothetical protein